MNYRLLSIISVFCAGVSLSAQNFPYQNPNLSAKERAVDLCSRLTLEEKAQLKGARSGSLQSSNP